MHDSDLPSLRLDPDRPQVAPIACIECGRLWLDARERWRIYVLFEEPPEAVPYCDRCAAREFG